MSTPPNSTTSPLHDIIAKVEEQHFRTNEDSGANPLAMMIHNMYRNAAGLPYIRREDLAAYNPESDKYELPEQSNLIVNTKTQPSPILPGQIFSSYAFTLGQRVFFDNGVFAGIGVIVGCALCAQPIVGALYMVRPIDSKVIPNETYPFDTAPINECHLRHLTLGDVFE